MVIDVSLLNGTLLVKKEIYGDVLSMTSDQGSRGLAERLAQKSEWTADEFKKWIREVGEEIKKMECGIAGIRKGNKE